MSSKIIFQRTNQNKLIEKKILIILNTLEFIVYVNLVLELT